ncbi:helix-turn-helix transcriptional regulator [Methanococcoides sp. FTZ1]|uniref:helix-turn-helix transcriptional regulator n=1 Tax=Methanococcoides sp. FTZ1 TaxID=3439061 RepID=UPI003F82F74E
MKPSPADLLMYSDRRRKVLISLFDGPKTEKEIHDILKTEWYLLKHSAKELKDSGLIAKHESKLHLTNIGKLLMETSYPLLNLLDLFESNSEYWIGRYLDEIPLKLLMRLGEIEEYEILYPDMDSIFEPLKSFVENVSNLQCLQAILVAFNPESIKFLLNKINLETQVTLIITEGYLEKMKSVLSNELNSLMESDNIEIFVLDQSHLPSHLIITENKVKLIIYNNDKIYDYKELVSYNPKAINWATELFIYYKFLSQKLD